MIAIQGGKVTTMDSGTIPCGTVLVRDGRILSVYEGLEVPSDAQVVRAHGKVVAPGFIDSHCHVGIVPEGRDWEYSHVNEDVGSVTGDARALDGIDFDDMGFRDALSGGVTSMVIHPGSSNVICGTGVAVKAAGPTVESRILRDPVGMKVAWTAGAKRGPRPVAGIPYPSTRMGIAAILRRWLLEARGAGGKPSSGATPKEVTLAILGRVLGGEIPLVIHCMTLADISPLFRLQDEFGFRFTIEHGDEAHLAADEIARRRIHVNYGPLMGDRWTPLFPNARPDSPAILHAAGVSLSFITDHPVVSVRDLRFQAAISVRHGLHRDQALRALTIEAAKSIGLDHRIGSITPGKDADLVIFSGDPLSVQTNVETVYVGGERVL